MTAQRGGQTIAVLDVERGVARLMGNGAIYSSALQRFTTHIEAARAVAAQLAAGDLAGASRTLHTVKGAAGLLCADEVHAIAGELETLLAQGGAVGGLLDEFDKALQRVQARIDVAVPVTHVAPVPPMPRETIRNVPELLDRLGALLGEGNARALDMLDNYGAVLERALDRGAWETITAAARDHDFERALAALRAARLEAHPAAHPAALR